MILDAEGKPIPFDNVGACNNCGERDVGVVCVGLSWLCEECAKPIIAKRLKRVAAREEI